MTLIVSDSGGATVKDVTDAHTKNEGAAEQYVIAERGVGR